MLNTYLSYYKTENIAGIDYFYFRSLFLPAGWPSEWVDMFLNIGQGVITQALEVFWGSVPDTIPLGTEISHVNGGVWVAPCTLRKAILRDFSLSLEIVSPEIGDLVSRAPWVVYMCASLGRPPRNSIPEEFQAPLAACSSGEFSAWYIPPEFALMEVSVASRYNNFPFWVTCHWQYFWAYDGCDYSGVPGHITNNMSGWAWLWQENTTEGSGYGDIYYKLNDRIFDLRSCLEGVGYAGWPIHYEYSGPSLSALWATVIMPVEPVVWFESDLFDYPPAPRSRRSRSIPSLNSSLVNALLRPESAFPVEFDDSFFLTAEAALRDDNGVILTDDNGGLLYA